jgi:protein SCO1/2
MNSGTKRMPRRAPASLLLATFYALCAVMISLGVPRAFSAAASSPQTFEVKGVVQRLDPENGKAVIRHEAIPDYMDAMTMPFQVKDRQLLKTLTPGDAVSFRLVVTEEESWVDRIEKIPGTASSKVLVAPAGASQVAQSSGVAGNLKHHPLLDYAFTNQFGQPVRLSQFRGQALAITFIFTRCPIPDYCPRLTKNFEEAAQKLQNMEGGPANYHFLSVTIDPEFDTPAVLKTYGERFGYDPTRWSFLTGPAEKIAELAKLSGMNYQGRAGLINHDLRTLIIDPNGRLQTAIPVGGNLSDLIVTELVKVLSPGSQGGLRVEKSDKRSEAAILPGPSAF